MCNIDLFFEKLENSGVPKEGCDTLREKYGEILISSSFATKAETGIAYPGSLIDVSMKMLTVYAVKLNQILPEKVRAEKNSIVKICLLQHISKCLRLAPNDDQWRAEKLGESYMYVNEVPAIGVGLHSMMIAIECGIPFTPEEAEAITIIDRKSSDMQAKYHASNLSSIVKQANELVYMVVNVNNM